MPEERMKLGNAPKNVFMPKAENLKCMKIKREEGSKPGIPEKISTENNFEIWFKQDDSFDQPFVSIEGEIQTGDCGFPLKTESRVMSSFWRFCFDEHMREISYMADLAGNSVNYGFGESLKFSHMAYNDNVEKYLQEFLSQV